MTSGSLIIACIGECMLELRAESRGVFRQAFAGDVYNTAVYLKRSLPESDVRFITVTGDDLLSGQMRDAWRDEGVNGDYAFFGSGAPGLYMIHLDENGERSFSYWRSQSPARSWLTRLEAAGGVDYLAGADLVYLSGVSLAILPHPDRVHALRLLSDLRGRVGLIAFDPNYRQSLWPSLSEAQAAIAAAAQSADILLPSEEDLLALSLDLRGREIVETLGSHGCRVTYDGRVKKIPSIEVVERPCDTSGAGDSFNGAYLASRLRGDDPYKAAESGLSVASRVVQSLGAIILRERSHG